MLKPTEYYGKIMEVVDALDSTDSSTVAAVKPLPSEQLLEDILFVDSNFKIVSKSITLLESSKLQLSKALNIVDKVSGRQHLLKFVTSYECIGICIVAQKGQGENIPTCSHGCTLVHILSAGDIDDDGDDDDDDDDNYENDVHNKLGSHCIIPKGFSIAIAIAIAISFTRKINKIIASYTLGGETIPEVNECKYLGITFSSDLCWGEHVTDTVGKAWRALHFVMRVLRKGSDKSKEIAYKSLRLMPAPDVKALKLAPQPEAYCADLLVIDMIIEVLRIAFLQNIELFINRKHSFNSP
ncbi:hypothetical protein ANN_04231 [Periplaneta americana]|uniref:Uncharacterized protein n=1 Tax=Periplaneta americana TaxID=6978 RepID=A0ABQ8T9T9_PERAM|nr:hypothetical protein ANN_04231 [Periplaneta americana]